MKKLLLISCIICFLVFIIPAAAIGIENLLQPTENTAILSEDAAEAAAALSAPYQITLYLSKTNETVNIGFEDYITAMTAAEMPPSFELEALKAQAVAARSYILNKLDVYNKNGVPESHHGAMLCDDEAHCKRYIPFSDTQSRWDKRYTEDYSAKIKRAVSETKGEYLSYNGTAAKACFYAVSSGKTEDISDVWGTELPYLVSVDSSADTRADGYHSKVFYPMDAFVTAIKGARQSISIPENSDSIVGKVLRTKGGGVAEIELCGESFKGAEIQQIFHLRSTCFSVNFENGKAVFDVKGYGHGVGMSQAGANFMAQGGKNYRDILSHYYPGTAISALM